MSDSGLQPRPAPAGYDGWAVISLDRETVVRLNDRAAHLLGFGSELLPVHLADAVTPTDLRLLSDRVLPQLRAGQVWNGGLRLGANRVDASPLPAMLLPHVSDAAELPEFASLLVASPDAATDAALVPDPLTGLPTRSALFRRLEYAVQRNLDTATLLVALFIDLDGLKNINDRYGHEVGDTALIETAQRIASQIPDGALAVRFGGDEFVIVYEDAPDLDHAETLAAQILAALDEVGDYHAISASIGIAVARSGEVDATELIRRADGAMYRAKARGGAQIAVFDAEMRTKQRTDEAMRASLLHAITNNGFGVAAQPVFELATGDIRGVELFIRVRDDATYVTNANQLFRLAHEYGEAFDAAVLGRALALAKVWQGSLGPRAPRVHINVSTQSLAASHFTRRVANALASDGLSGRALAFEVDGRDLSTAGERERATIEGLRDLGSALVIDGYGDGSLSLADLADWRPSLAKIAAGDFSAPVLAGLIRAVSSLGVPTCIKGVGTHDELQRAVALGSYGGQGNALTPVRSIDRVNAQLHGPQRLGF